MEEIVNPNLPSSGISPLYSGHSPVDSEPAPEEGGQDIADMFGPSREEVLLSSHSGLFDRQTSKCLHSNSVWAPSCEEHADGQYQGSGKFASELCSWVRTLRSCASRVAVVDRNLKQEIFCECQPRAGCDNHIRCKHQRLGSRMSGPDGPRSVVPHGEGTTHQWDHSLPCGKVVGFVCDSTTWLLWHRFRRWGLPVPGDALLWHRRYGNSFYLTRS